MKWTGPAQWMKREARAGDRLPFDRHIDDATIRLRDGALMRTLQIGGLEFETADSDHLDQLLHSTWRLKIRGGCVPYRAIGKRR